MVLPKVINQPMYYFTHYPRILCTIFAASFSLKCPSSDSVFAIILSNSSPPVHNSVTCTRKSNTAHRLTFCSPAGLRAKIDNDYNLLAFILWGAKAAKSSIDVIGIATGYVTEAVLQTVDGCNHKIPHCHLELPWFWPTAIPSTTINQVCQFKHATTPTLSETAARGNGDKAVDISS